MSRETTSEYFFEKKYVTNSDPWQFASSEYEQQRYTATMEALRPDRFARAFEPGCSIGILTERLAAVCDRVEAMDISATAVSLARKRCADYPHVNIRRGALPADISGGMFDLVVLSEIGYYFDEFKLVELVRRIACQLRRGGTLLAVHWLGISPDHAISGDTVHGVVSQVAELVHEHGERHAGFRLDRWSRAG